LKEPLNNERELLLLLADGDKQAFKQLFEQYWSPVYSVGLKMTKSPESARDLAQEVFLKIWDQRMKWPAVENFEGYLYRMTRNLSINFLQVAAHRESNRNFLFQYFAHKPTCPQEVLEGKQLGAKVLSAIDRLPAQLKQVFIMHRMEGLSHDEIACRLDITPLSSKTYMVRALLQLRQKLPKDIGKLLIFILLFLKS
jgi:RNA polymerase sigma-70 factor (ECF subfamily)